MHIQILRCKYSIFIIRSIHKPSQFHPTHPYLSPTRKKIPNPLPAYPSIHAYNTPHSGTHNNSKSRLSEIHSFPICANKHHNTSSSVYNLVARRKKNKRHLYDMTCMQESEGREEKWKVGLAYYSCSRLCRSCHFLTIIIVPSMNYFRGCCILEA
jgi:hypothetical protein